MATGVQFRDQCVALGTGKQYNSLPQYRFGPNSYDCSGLMFKAAQSIGLTIPTVSWTQARWCHQAGTDGLQIDAALREAGCLLFKGARQGFDGWGADGHVACSMGDGIHTMEAHSAHTTPEVGVFDARGRPWTNAAHIPGLLYSGKSTPTPPPKEGPMYETDQVCSVYTDGEGHAWALFPTGAVDTITGGLFYGSYLSLRDASGQPFPARTDFAHITGRFDGKPGYTLWPANWKPGQIGFNFPVGK